MMDPAMLEPGPPASIERIAVRFPQIWSMASIPPERGGLTLTDWVLALDGYCRSLGVDGSMDGADVILRAGDQALRASCTASGRLEMTATL